MKIHEIPAKFATRTALFVLSALLILVAVPALLYAVDGGGAIPAVTDGSTRFYNPHPEVGTNDPLDPISVYFSDPDGINKFATEMWFDDLEVTKCNAVGVGFYDDHVIWDHTVVTQWGTACKALAAEKQPMEDGTHTVRVKVTDGQQNVSEYTWDFTIDRTPPELTPPSVCGQTVMSDTVADITYTYSDATSGIDPGSVTMYIDGNAVAAQVDAAQAVYTATGLADGAHQVSLDVSDAAGNQYGHACTFTVDTQPPEIQAVSPAAGGQVRIDNPVIEGSWSDAGAGVDQCSATIELDGEDVTAAAALGEYGFSFQAQGLALGTHQVHVTVSDQVGRTADYTWEFEYIETITYYAPWYDSKPENGMRGNWIIISNLEDQDAYVTIDIGGEPMPNPDYKPPAADGASQAEYTDAGSDQYGAAADQYTFVVPAHDRITPSFAGVTGGPVRVVSQNAKELLVSQRVLFGDSFNEVMAVRDSDLDSEYYFTWYDSKPENGMRGDWILVGNPSSDASADVYIEIGGQGMGQWQIPPGGIVTPSFPNVMAGPVKVTCTSCGPDRAIIASQRVIFNGSFTEAMGIPSASLDDEYYFTWYDSKPENGMRGDWILVGNPSSDASADVYIEIGGERMLNPLPGAPKNTHFYVPPHGIITPSFPGVMDGPVHVICSNCGGGMKLFASQRVLFRSSFEEVQGTSPEQMGTSAVFGWYDLKSEGMAGDWILVGNNANAAVHVYISVGGQHVGGPDPYVIDAFSRVTPSFAGVMGGPVEVVCENCNYGQKLIVSQRVIYKDSFNELIGLPPRK